MNRFYLQVRRGEEWRKLNTVPFDPQLSRRKGEVHSRATALADCQRQKDGWSQYYALPIRIVEEVDFRNLAVVG